MVNISGINRKLFGVSYLKDDANKKMVEQLWNSRFSPRTSFLLSATEEDTVQNIVDRFQDLLQKQKIQSLAGEQCILTFFVDCTEAFSENMFTILSKQVSVMEMLWGCSVEAEVQFCYLGKLGLGSREAQRNNLRIAVENNAAKNGVGYHRLCVVATPSMGAAKAYNWKAVMLYVDLLRRCSSLSNLFKNPGVGAANACVGYLHYEEYDKMVHDKLLAQKHDLSRRLGKNGENELRKLLQKKREDIINDAKDRFVIDAEFQPIHPGMILEEDTFFKKPRRDARRGKNEKFNAARDATRNTVMTTGFRLRAEIDAYMRQNLGSAAQVLGEGIREAGVGLGTKRDRVVMQSALKLPGLATGEEPALELAYDEAGYAQEIKSYLEYIRQSAISVGIQRFSKGLLEAYEKITPEMMDAEKAELKDKLAEVEGDLEEYLSAEEMCTAICAGRDPRHTQFKIDHSVAAASAKLLVSRGNDMAQRMDHCIGGGSLTNYCINHPNGGIVEPDNAPVKALRIVYAQCNDNALMKLLPEVNV